MRPANTVHTGQFEPMCATASDSQQQREKTVVPPASFGRKQLSPNSHGKYVALHLSTRCRAGRKQNAGALPNSDSPIAFYSGLKINVSAVLKITAATGCHHGNWIDGGGAGGEHKG